MVDIVKLREKALKILQKKRDIYFFCDLATELGYSRQYLYEAGFSPDKDDILKEALDDNKKYIKRGLRNKWYNDKNATTQVALYRLLADDDELIKLNNTRVELTGAGGESLAPPIINILPVKANGNDSTDTE